MKKSFTKQLFALTCLLLLSGLPLGCSEINRILVEHPCEPQRAAVSAAQTALTNAQNAESTALQNRKTALQNLTVALAALTAATIAFFGCLGGPIACAVVFSAFLAANVYSDTAEAQYKDAQAAYVQAQAATKAAQTTLDQAKKALDDCEKANSSHTNTTQNASLTTADNLAYYVQRKETLEQELKQLGGLQKVLGENKKALDEGIASIQANVSNRADIDSVVASTNRRIRSANVSYNDTKLDYDLVIRKIESLHNASQ